MDKKELIASIAKKVKIDPSVAESVVNDVVAELASPYIFRVPGGEVGLLDNNCDNRCKAPIEEIRELIQVAQPPVRQR